MRLFYDPNIQLTDDSFTLSEEESKHIIRVLRCTVGDEIGILDGKGHLFKTKISVDNPKKCSVRIVSIDTEKPLNHDVHIAVAPTKQNERIEWFVEKATEIGITEISLIECDNSERSRTKIERLQKKAVSAMKQSNRKYLPKINALSNFKSFVNEHPNGLIAHCYDETKGLMSDNFRTTNCPIIIGPEGDFSKAEIDLAISKGYKTLTLGENRLRTETAALYACMQAKLLTS